MRALLSTFVVVVATACGGTAATPDAAAPTPDGAVAIDAALPDAATLPPGCDYAETRDLTNDDVPPATGTPEATGLTFAGHAALCGSFASDHFDGDITVDVDGYVVTLAADADVLVRLAGPGLAGIELVGVDVYTGPTLSQFVGTSTVYGDHGVTALHLAAGRYELAVFALAGKAIPAPIAYTVELATDTPTRCPALPSGGYAEAHDGAMNSGNDMIRFASGMPPALSPSATDAPEPTQLVLDAATPARLSGAAAKAVVADSYEDKDTFAFTTGATTNELTVRLGWPSATADLDYFLFEAGVATPIVRVATTASQQPELRTFAVKPGTSYWLLVGAKVGSTGLPASYAATMCGAAFTP
jgi:hypothetical protein